MKRLRPLALLALSGLASLALAADASAAPSDPFQYKSSFAIPSSEFPGDIAVNYETGNILVWANQAITQYGPNGQLLDFPALGSPTIPINFGGGVDLIVDNTGTATQGNIYLIDQTGCCGFAGERFWSFGEDGSSLGVNPHEGYGNFAVRAGGVLDSGQVWLVGFDFNNGSARTLRVEPSGPAVGSMQAFALNGGYAPSAFDGLNNLYMPGNEGTYRRYDFDGGYTDEGETGLPVNEMLQVDPSTNDVYSRAGGTIVGVHYSKPLVKATPFEAIKGVNYGGAAFAFDGTGQTLYVAEGKQISVFHREPAAAPVQLTPIGVDGIRSSRGALHTSILASGAPTSYHFEYGTDTSYGAVTPEAQAPYGYFPTAITGSLEGLQVDTTYHVRLVATNAAGTTVGPDRTFKTYAIPPGGPDPCPNALARKQTGARALPDCRAFELVSAGDSGGYEVESYLAPGQTGFPGFPLARDRVLYATHSGAVPGPWNATNKGPDPYLASRGPDGWSTSYLGLPSNLNEKAGGFSSVLGEADSKLDTLAFAGPDLCSPCFPSGIETGIPVRLPSGQLIQGMAGSLDPGAPTAMPEGKVGKYFSGDGSRLVFASKYAFEPGANTNGDLTVYARNLGAGTTEIVSKAPGGATLTGAGISELDVSVDGSRILFAQKVAADSAGNEYVHPYLHLAGSTGSVDLAPGASDGVLFAGMSSDGSEVFFTTLDSLAGADTDASADLYEAAVDAGGALDLSLVTPKSSNACSPVANSARPHWNSVGASADCSAVAVAGGGGLAAGGGAIYFLSPEQLDGTAGALDQPNLYEVRPGQAPTFVATLEPDNPLVLDSVGAAGQRQTGDFQTSSDGRYAVFASSRALTGVGNFGFRSVFRYDAVSGELDCVSCDTTGTSDASLAADSLLAPNGLSLIEDGRVFFTTKAALVLNDANGRKDVYEWAGGDPQLISAGTGPFDSALLSVSADGTDAFFYTHDTLAAEEDHNGLLTKIYDARVGGGFFTLPPTVPCAASDECHGPGTVAPPPPSIKSSGATTTGNVLVCKKNQVKRRNKCEPKKGKQPRKHRHASKRRGKRHA